MTAMRRPKKPAMTANRISGEYSAKCLCFFEESIPQGPHVPSRESQYSDSAYDMFFHEKHQSRDVDEEQDKDQDDNKRGVTMPVAR
jgi:hypothetical protein